MKSLSRVQLFATPWTVAYQAPQSMGFLRQEYWSGVPFPSPMHESETWKWSLSVVSDSSWPHGLQPTRLLHPWDFSGKSTGVGCHFLLQGIFPTQGSNPGLLHCRQTVNCLSHHRSLISFCCTAKWFSYTHTYILFHYGLLQDSKYGIVPCMIR